MLASSSRLRLLCVLVFFSSALTGCEQAGQPPLGIQRAALWSPLPVIQDPLMRMPGTQQNQGTTLEGSNRCLNCHGDYNSQVKPGLSGRCSCSPSAGP